MNSNALSVFRLRPALHPLHPGTHRLRMPSPILSPIHRPIFPTYIPPSSEWHHHTRTIIRRAQIFCEMDDRLGCAGGIERPAGEVDDFLVGDEGGDTVRDEDHVRVCMPINHPGLDLRLDRHARRFPPPIPKPPRILHRAHPPRLAVRIGD